MGNLSGVGRQPEPFLASRSISTAGVLQAPWMVSMVEIEYWVVRNCVLTWRKRVSSVSCATSTLIKAQEDISAPLIRVRDLLGERDMC